MGKKTRAAGRAYRAKLNTQPLKIENTIPEDIRAELDDFSHYFSDGLDDDALKSIFFFNKSPDGGYSLISKMVECYRKRDETYPVMKRMLGYWNAICTHLEAEQKQGGSATIQNS